MPDSEELNRMMVEISAGWEYGDPRSKVPKRKDVEESWARLKVEMDEIKAEGGIVEIPGEIPDISERIPRSNIKRTYLLHEINGKVGAIYMIEQGPGFLRDWVLGKEGWIPTQQICDWRIGQRDYDEITRKEAKEAAKSLDIEKYIK